MTKKDIITIVVGLILAILFWSWVESWAGTLVDRPHHVIEFPYHIVEYTDFETMDANCPWLQCIVGDVLRWEDINRNGRYEKHEIGLRCDMYNYSTEECSMLISDEPG